MSTRLSESNELLSHELDPVSDVSSSYMLRIHGCVFCSFPRLSVYLRLRMSSNPRSVAGILFNLSGHFQASLLRYTTCMYS